MHQKPFLPSKYCCVCGRTFTWRKKWAKDWEAVKYCSERCRRQRSTPQIHLSNDNSTPNSG